MSITVSSTRSTLSVNGGLVAIKELVAKLGLGARLSTALPSGPKATDKCLNMVYGFATGADCLDDLERLGADDAGYRAVVSKDYSAKTYGDWLRTFEPIHCKQAVYSLAETSMDLRAALGKPAKHVVIDLDSTVNEQWGKKMEDVRMCYEGTMGYDTLHAFDEQGLPYWTELRPGGTYSSNGSGEVIHSVLYRFRTDPRFRHLRRYSRGDSAFCNAEYFNACASAEAGFVCAMRDNMLSPVLDSITHWEAQNRGKVTRIMFYDGRECEIGETVYKHEGCVQTLRVVVIRARKEKVQMDMFGKVEIYDYHAWITNIGEHEMSSERVIKFYRGRGTAENYIKETKYGFDLKNYPCLKFLANRAFGVIAMMSYALMRFVAILRAEKGLVHFAKLTRHKIIRLPAIVVRHGRKVTFKFMEHHAKEVTKLIDAIKTVQFGLSTCLSG